MDEETLDLKNKDFYEWVRVGKSRKSKHCCICYKTLPAGTAQNGMRFYGEDGNFPVYWLCPECEVSHKDLIAEITA